MDADKKTTSQTPQQSMYGSTAMFGGGKAALGCNLRGDFSACKGRIPLWQPQEGGDAAVGRAGMLAALAVWDLRHTHSMTRFTGWE